MDIVGKSELLNARSGMGPIYMPFYVEHSVTIKLPNCRYYNNTTNDIYRGRSELRVDRENVYLYDMQVSVCLVGTYGDYNCFGEVSFSVVSKVQNGSKSSD
jgi:hypothetical protein